MLFEKKYLKNLRIGPIKVAIAFFSHILWENHADTSNRIDEESQLKVS